MTRLLSRFQSSKLRIMPLPDFTTPYIYESASEHDTVRFANDFAKNLSSPTIVALHGPVGAGKSFISRQIIKSLYGDSIIVPSPTFTLVQTYNDQKLKLWHFDLYRLNDPDEIFEIGWEEALLGDIVLVEWPEKLGPYMPDDRIDMIIHPAIGSGRKIILHDRRRS